MWADEVYRISILNEASSAAIRANEGAQSPEEKAWSCNHCSVHLNNLQTQEHVVEHVMKSQVFHPACYALSSELTCYLRHAIADPQETVDHFRAPLPYNESPPKGTFQLVEGTYQDLDIGFGEVRRISLCPESEGVDWSSVPVYIRKRFN